MSELSTLNLNDDFEEVLQVEEASGWSLERMGDLEIWATLSPCDHPIELFTARLVWTEYPGDFPASVTFVDPDSGLLGVPTAWPVAAGFRPPNDICANWTSEGYIAHPEWKGDRSKRLVITGNALLLSLRCLQHELDCTFTGRFKP